MSLLVCGRGGWWRVDRQQVEGEGEGGGGREVMMLDVVLGLKVMGQVALVVVVVTVAMVVKVTQL